MGKYHGRKVVDDSCTAALKVVNCSSTAASKVVDCSSTAALKVVDCYCAAALTVVDCNRIAALKVVDFSCTAALKVVDYSLTAALKVVDCGSTAALRKCGPSLSQLACFNLISVEDYEGNSLGSLTVNFPPDYELILRDFGFTNIVTAKNKSSVDVYLRQLTTHYNEEDFYRTSYFSRGRVTKSYQKSLGVPNQHKGHSAAATITNHIQKEWWIPTSASNSLMFWAMRM